MKVEQFFSQFLMDDCRLFSTILLAVLVGLLLIQLLHYFISYGRMRGHRNPAPDTATRQAGLSVIVPLHEAPSSSGA